MADDDTHGPVLLISRAVGAVSLLVIGGDHLQQYTVAHFSVIPTIGPLFLLNFISAAVLGLVLLVPSRRTPGPRRLLVDSIAALGGIGVAAGALAALLISEHTPLFGFMEHGYRLEIVIAIVADAVAIVSLGVFLTIAHSRAQQCRNGSSDRGGRLRARSASSPREA
jgi:hypothetical protein